MPGSLSDLLSALNDPEGYIYNRVKRGEMDAETKLRENLLASGYMGERQPSGITEPRGIFGSIGESIGLLGPQQPRPLTPYERMLVTQGGVSRETSDLGLEGKRLDISGAQERAKFNNITNALKLYDFTGVPSPELITDPNLRNDYEGGMIRAKKEHRRAVQKDNLADTALRLRNQWMVQGIKGERKTASAKEAADKALARSKAWDNSNIGKQFAADLLRFKGNPKGAFGPEEGDLAKLEAETDPVERANIMASWSEYKKQLRAAMIAAQVDPTLIEEYIQSLDNYGKYEEDPISMFGRGEAAPAPAAPGVDPKQAFIDDLNSRMSGQE